MELRRRINKVSDALENDLRRDIYRKQLLPGDKLLSEEGFAKKYCISRSTVRQALSNLLSEGLIEKIQGAGTYVSAQPQSVRLHSFSPTIPERQILFLSFSTAFSEETLYMKSTFDPIFNGIGRVLNAYRYNLLIAHVDHTWQAPSALLNGDVGGILFHGYVEKSFWDMYMADLPCVGIQHLDSELNCSWVGVDNIARSYLAVKHLYDQGHRRIAFFVRGMEADSLDEQRMAAFKRVMRRLGMDCPEEHCIVAPSQRVEGERRPDEELPDFSPWLQVFKGPNPPTALIISNNYIAVARSFEKLGLNIPKDVSLVSADNLVTNVRYTYINDRLEDICSEGAKLLIEQIENGKPYDQKTILIKPALIVGNSVIKK